MKVCKCIRSRQGYRMRGVGRALRLPDTDPKEYLVRAIGERVDRLGQHGARTCEYRSSKFRHGDTTVGT